MHRSGDVIQCPVRAWAAFILRISAYPGTNEEYPVNLFYADGKLHEITGEEVLISFRAAATTIGSEKLGFDPWELGTNSLRAGAAMAMYLDDVPVVWSVFGIIGP